MKSFFSLLVLGCLLASSAHGIINFGRTNGENTSDPGNGSPFGSVAEITFFSLNDPRGSGVYLGNNFVLTANHVDVNLGGAGQVRFNPAGSAIAIDTTFTPVQVAPGLDLKIIRLVSDPGVPAVKLLSTPIESTLTTATVVGWGIGRDPGEPINTNSVTWDASFTTQDKRWGENVIRGAQTIEYTNGQAFSYEALFTILGSGTGDPAGVGANEAAATTLDSGGGLFQFLEGEWQLVGVATLVEEAVENTSTFADDSIVAGRGDANFYVRISEYADEINSIIPEPSTYALAFGALALLIATRYRARRA